MVNYSWNHSFRLLIIFPAHCVCLPRFVLPVGNQAAIVPFKQILNEGETKHLEDLLLRSSPIKDILECKLFDFMIIIDGDSISIYLDTFFLDLFLGKQWAYPDANGYSLFAH